MKYLGKSEQGVHPLRVHALIFLFERDLFQLTAKNLQAMRSLISVCQLNGATLMDSWHLVLGSLEVRLLKCGFLMFFEERKFRCSIWCGFWV